MPLLRLQVSFVPVTHRDATHPASKYQWISGDILAKRAITTFISSKIGLNLRIGFFQWVGIVMCGGVGAARGRLCALVSAQWAISRLCRSLHSPVTDLLLLLSKWRIITTTYNHTRSVITVIDLSPTSRFYMQLFVPHTATRLLDG